MDPLETDSVEFTRETSSSNLLSTDVETGDCGDPPIAPRIGDEYQVVLPPIRATFGSSKVQQKPNHAEETDDCSFGVGLDIPVHWIPVPKRDGENENKGSTDGVCEAKSASLRNMEICLNLDDNSCSKSAWTDLDIQRSLLETRINTEGLDEAFYDGKKTCMETLPQQQMKPGCSVPLPDRTCILWTDNQVNICLLGLYIFGKNLSLVGRFMEAKGVGDILLFYYGKFYQSNAYKRWSECRKSKNRKFIQGQRIFTGWRQQELLSRLLPNLREENRHALLEVMQGFNCGAIPFEEFVFKLKAMVGLQALVDAIAIGEGKRDLTGISLDLTKTAAAPSSRHDIPVGKACSSLTSAEIISFLTGDFRLSKTRSNDLFWEAVWPRLLARGWHSEQPKNQRCSNTRQTLVFLVPGVRKFSRRKLQKGNHYFDSVTDVLNKVASDPKLLELDAEGGIGVSKENACVADLKVEQNGPNSTLGLMKFTIVDTSLVQGESPHKITDLRTLPLDSSYKFSNLTQSHSFSGSDGTDRSSSSSESSDDQKDHVDMQMDGQEAVRRSMDCADNIIGSVPPKMEVQIQHSHHTFTGSRKRQARKRASEKSPHNLIQELPANGICSDSTHQLKSGKQVYLSPVSKRCRLTVCKHTTVRSRIHTKTKENRRNKCVSYESFNPSDSVLSVEPIQPSCKESTTSSGKDSLNGSSDNTFLFGPLDNHADNKVSSSDGKSQSRVLLDLNVPPEIDANETHSGEVSDNQRVVTVNGNMSSDTSQPPYDSQVFGQSNFKQPNTNLRRQSTRSRPPTTRVLESLESGFFSLRRKAQSSKGLPTNKSSHCQRKVHQAPQLLQTRNKNGVVDVREDDVNNDGLRSFDADSSLSSTSQVVLEGGGLMYNFLDRPQTINPESTIKDHIS